MRLIVMGTGPFAVPMFRSLLSSSHSIIALVTRPTSDMRAGAPPSNPMRDEAERQSLKVLAPDSINSAEARDFLSKASADVFVVCDYGQILKSATLRLARLGGINLHASLLPKYRGAAPIQWAIYQGETETGVTVIHMTPKLDGGPRLAWRSTPIGANETSPELEARLANLGIDAVHESLARLDGWDGIAPLGELQDSNVVTLAPRLSKQDGQIDWSRTAGQIANQVRAFKPWPASYTYVPQLGKAAMRLIVEQVRVVESNSAGTNSQSQSLSPGQIVVCDGKQLCIATGEGILAIDAVQPAGKRVMSIREFLNGYRLRPGDRLEKQT